MVTCWLMSQHYINANSHWGGWSQRARGTTYSPTSRRMCLDWWLYAGCCPIPSISRALEVARRKRPPGVCVHNNISSFRACFYLPKILLGFLRVKCFRGGIFFEFQFQFCMEKLDAGITNQFWKGLKSFHVRTSLFPASEWWYPRYRLGFPFLRAALFLWLIHHLCSPYYSTDPSKNAWALS